MQISGLHYGKQLLDLVEFPVAETLNGSATRDQIQQMLDKYGKIVVKPVFYVGVGKKGKAGLVRIVDNIMDAMSAKEELFFASHQYGLKMVRANGVTFEEYIRSKSEVYFSIAVSTRERKPIFTLTPFGGVDVEELPFEKKRVVWIDPFIGIKSFDITNALNDVGCPERYISPLVQNLPKLWALYDNYGLTTIELNPILMKETGNRVEPVACDLKAAFDQDNPAWRRLGIPNTIFQSEVTPFEAEINLLRTYQGQSDVLELNRDGKLIPFMFGGGANTAATEILGDLAIYASDFGGNPPYKKMYDIGRIVFKYWLKQASMLLIIGGKANNTDIFITFKGIFDALRDHIAEHGKHPVYTVIGRGGPNLVRGMLYAKDILDTLRLPYKIFGFDTSMIEVLEYAKKLNLWWIDKGQQIYTHKN